MMKAWEEVLERDFAPSEQVWRTQTSALTPLVRSIHMLEDVCDVLAFLKHILNRRR